MITESDRDVMQVCLNGHVITDRLASHPDEGLGCCDRCGAATISRCPTCGRDLPGALPLPGLATIGERQPPEHCPGCGAALPWSEVPAAAHAPGTLAVLEPLLRRLPRAARQLRDRYEGRPSLRVEDEHDLEDLLRAVLHLHFDDVRREGRTPGYDPGTRTDFIVGPEALAVTAKLVTPDVTAESLLGQLREDVAYYQRQPTCGGLVALAYDPEQRLCDRERFEAACRRSGQGFDLRCVVAT
jgi:hypothetical protein